MRSLYLIVDWGLFWSIYNVCFIYMNVCILVCMDVCMEVCPAQVDWGLFWSIYNVCFIYMNVCILVCMDVCMEVCPAQVDWGLFWSIYNVCFIYMNVWILVCMEVCPEQVCTYVFVVAMSTIGSELWMALRFKKVVMFHNDFKATCLSSQCHCFRHFQHDIKMTKNRQLYNCFS